MSESSNYIPGMCNINPAEIRRRRMSGHIGLAATIVVIIIMVIIQANWLYRLILFAPLYMAAIGYLQANSKFCVAYATTGKQHADSVDIASVEDESARKADQLRARMLYLKAFLIAAVLTAIFCIIPIS